MNRGRFPSLAGGWARLDAPMGTQMVDAAIEAMDAWNRSGRGANQGGVLPPRGGPVWLAVAVEHYRSQPPPVGRPRRSDSDRS